MLQENITQLFTDAFHQYWDKDMYSDLNSETPFKYKDTANQIGRIHSIFKEFGIKKGDKVALFGRNTANWCIDFLATVTYGAVIVPILPDFSAEDVHHIVNHSDSKLFFAGKQLSKALDISEMKEIKAMIAIDELSNLNESDESVTKKLETANANLKEKYPNGIGKDDLSFEEINNDDLVILNYTSGTTGFSKGVMIPGRSVVGNITFGRDFIPMDIGANVVSFLPLAHTFGCSFDFLLGVLTGAHITLVSKTPSPQILIPLFKSQKPQIIMTVPLIVEKIYKKRVLPKISKPSMKILLKIPGISNLIYKKIKSALLETFGGNLNEMIIGGAPLSAEAEAFFKKIKFPFTVGYGMTECGPLISYAPWQKTEPQSAGKLLDRMEMKIESNDPYNIPGEICVRGVNLMTGYYKNEEATNEVLDKDGWLHTGDMGITDEDEFIYIKGRSKTMLLGPSGQNIYPEEIEARLNNLPYVGESIVLQDKDHKLYALVYADPDAVKETKLSKNELLAQMEENRKTLNKQGKNSEVISRFEMHEEEFIKTPKRSIKRFLYEKK